MRIRARRGFPVISLSLSLSRLRLLAPRATRSKRRSKPMLNCFKAFGGSFVIGRNRSRRGGGPSSTSSTPLPSLPFLLPLGRVHHPSGEGVLSSSFRSSSFLRVPHVGGRVAEVPLSVRIYMSAIFFVSRGCAFTLPLPRAPHLTLRGLFSHGCFSAALSFSALLPPSLSLSLVSLSRDPRWVESYKASV